MSFKERCNIMGEPLMNKAALKELEVIIMCLTHTKSFENIKLNPLNSQTDQSDFMGHPGPY